jgi:hypothetical protein
MSHAGMTWDVTVATSARRLLEQLREPSYYDRCSITSGLNRERVTRGPAEDSRTNADSQSAEPRQNSRHHPGRTDTC